jgi:hypothetical protein
MSELTKPSTDNTDNIERSKDEYDSTDDENENENENQNNNDGISSIQDGDEPAVPPKRVYRRKQPEQDKRRKGNHERTERQKAATARMLEVRRELNAERKKKAAIKVISRAKELEAKVSRRRQQQEEDDANVAEKIATEPEDSEDEPEPPRRPNKKKVMPRIRRPQSRRSPSPPPPPVQVRNAQPPRPMLRFV